MQNPSILSTDELHIYLCFLCCSLKYVSLFLKCLFLSLWEVLGEHFFHHVKSSLFLQIWP